MPQTDDERTLALALFEELRPLLAGKPPAVQGAALAHATACWLAGHVIPGNPAATRGLPERLLSHQIAAVHQMIAALDEAEREARGG